MNTPQNPATAYRVIPYTPAGATAPVLFLVPPSFSPSIQLQIPLLWTGTGDINDSANSFSNTNFSFRLAQQPQTGSPTPGNVYANIGISLGTSVFITDTKGRLALMASFTNFLQNLESKFEWPESPQTPLIVPGATFRIGQQIADNLPAPLSDLLFYRYALSSGLPPLNGNAYVDLRSGMRLRVETEMKQFTGPGSGAGNFYVGSGRFEYYISSIPNGSGPRQLVFDPFLGAIRTPTIQGAGTTPLIAGGLFDLQPVSGLQTYWRMFYPASVPPPNNTGDTQIRDNVALIGAPTLAALNQATREYPTPGDEALATVFLGRAVIVPEIPIWLTLNGQSALTYVSLGTTLTQIIERFIAVPLDVSQQLVTLARPMAVNDLQNWRTQMVNQPLVTFPTSTGQPPPPPPPPPWPSAAFFDVPLIAGDSVTLSL